MSPMRRLKRAWRQRALDIWEILLIRMAARLAGRRRVLRRAFYEARGSKRAWKKRRYLGS